MVIYAKDSVKFIPIGLDQSKTKKYSGNTIYSGANVTVRVDPGGDINCDPGTSLTVEIGAIVDCRPLNAGESTPTNIDPAFSAAYICPPPARLSEEDEEEDSSFIYDKKDVSEIIGNDMILITHDENFEKYTIYSPILNAIPNPFKETVIFDYKIEQTGPVELYISNMYGQKLSDLVNETNKPAGWYSNTYHAGNLKPGVNFYTLKTKDHSITKRMVMLK